MINNVIRLMRPEQWVKNLFVFAAPFFNGTFIDDLPSLLIAFAAFCLVSSAIYCLNDAVDYAYDAVTPAKKNRPVASGKVSRTEAVCVALVLAAVAIVMSVVLLSAGATCVLAGYLALNVLYCLWLKSLPIIDVFVISFGFVLRLVDGSVVANVPLTGWIVVMVFLLTLFLAFAKRRDELAMARDNARKSTRSYTREYVDLVLTLLAAILVTLYVAYTLLPSTVAQFHTDKLYVSALFVLGGMMRYLQIAVVHQTSGKPTMIFLRDKVIIACVLCWVACYVIAIYV